MIKKKFNIILVDDEKNHLGRCRKKVLSHLFGKGVCYSWDELIKSPEELHKLGNDRTASFWIYDGNLPEVTHWGNRLSLQTNLLFSLPETSSWFWFLKRLVSNDTKIRIVAENCLLPLDEVPTSENSFSKLWLCKFFHRISNLIAGGKFDTNMLVEVVGILAALNEPYLEVFKAIQNSPAMSKLTEFVCQEEMGYVDDVSEELFGISVIDDPSWNDRNWSGAEYAHRVFRIYNNDLRND